MNEKAGGINAEFDGNPKETFKYDIPPKLILSAAVFGAAFSYLFTRQTIGLNMFLFVLLVYAIAAINRKLFIEKSFAQEPWIYLFCIPVIFLAAFIFIGSTSINVLGFLLILFVMFAQYLVLSGNSLHKWNSPIFLLEMMIGFLNRIFLAIGLFTAGAVNNIFKKQSPKKKGAVIGVLIGIALLLLIVPMLMLSDINIAKKINEIFKNIYLGDVFLYAFVFFAGASIITAPIASAKRKELTGKRQVSQGQGKRPVEIVTAGVALCMISVVYIIFAAVQFSYFFLPEDTIASVLGLTSSAYAVRGFGELLFITCLNFIIIAFCLRFTKLKNGKTQVFIKVLYTILIAFNFVILASSHMRMQSYEAAYGYSVARFLSHSFMVLLLVLNAITLARIFTRIKISKVVIAASLLYFCVIVAINPELYVTKKNIDRYYQTGKIDAVYMFSLSGDAISEACDFVTEQPGEFDEDTMNRAKARLDSYERRNKDWQSLNIAEYNAYLKLSELLK